MNFQNLLACPYCKNKLSVKLICSNNLCIKFQTKLDFVKNKPVLIDFKNFVHNKKDFLNYLNKIKKVRTKSFVWNFFKSIVDGNPIVTKRNIQTISDELFNIDNPSILIIGGGTIGNGFEDFYFKYKNNITSFDIYYSQNIDFIADAHNIPFLNKTFDLIIIQAVLEHVLYPNKVVHEINRVLKINGYVYAETPFMQQVHEGAYDFTRFTDSGHRLLFSDFTLLKSGFVSGVGTSLLWSIDYFFSALFRTKVAGKISKLIFFWLRFFDLIVPSRYNIDGASGVYFLGIKQNKTLRDSNIIEYYNGSQN
jgi:SAM-dependent methyltransferase